MPITYKELTEYAVELAERFPDMTDDEIVLSCEEFADVDFPFSVGKRSIVIQAYEYGTENGVIEHDLKWWGYDPTDEVK